MDCVNHPGVERSAYCQSCGKALCASCVRCEPGGQILCEPCWAAWQAVRAPFVPAAPGMPNPGIAALLGIIPGVGAMYNGQFFKGLVHVVIFAILVSMSRYYGIFGIFIAAWIVYQSFEAYHTAKARREGDPLPDPLGLNEVGNWLQTGFQSEYRRTQAPPPGPPPGPAAGAAPTGPAAGSAYQGPLDQGVERQGTYQPPQYQGPHASPYQSGYQPPSYTPPQAPYAPYGGMTPGAGPPSASGFAPGFAPPPPVTGFGAPAPPVPPIPPLQARRRHEPIAAIVLIALGVLFLLGQISGRVVEFAWPLVLIALGVWLIVRRMVDSRPPAAAVPMQTAAAPQETAEKELNPRDREGGIL